MAYRLAPYRDRLLHVHGIGWHYWDGTRWAPTTSAPPNAPCWTCYAPPWRRLGDKQLQRDIRKCESNTGVTGVLGIAAALTRSPPPSATSTPTRIC